MTALLTFGVVARNNWHEYKNSEEIPIIFQYDNDRREVAQVRILRKNCTRAEMTGVLQILNKLDRHNIAYIKTYEFFRLLNDIQAKKRNELVIKIASGDEFIHNCE